MCYKRRLPIAAVRGSRLSPWAIDAIAALYCTATASTPCCFRLSFN